MTIKVFLEPNHRVSDIELSYWRNLFDSPACKVEITEDSRYYLTARRLEKITDHMKRRESAEQLKTMMIAFAKIELDKDFQRIEPDDTGDSISTIVEQTNDKQSAYFYPKPLAQNEASPLATFTILDEFGRPIKQERQERWYDFYLDQCDDWIDKTPMFKALDYFSKKTTPFTLWWAYETIETDEGGVLWCIKKRVGNKA